MSDLAWAVKNGDMEQVKEMVEAKVGPGHTVEPWQWSIGCSPPGGQSEQLKSPMHIPPFHDPRKWIPKGILIWSTRRPSSRLVFFTYSTPFRLITFYNFGNFQQLLTTCSAATAIRIASFLSHANVFCQTYSHFIHLGAKTSHFTLYLAAIHSG